MKFEIDTENRSRTVLDAVERRVTISEPELYIDARGRKWLPEWAYIVFERVDDEDWQVRQLLVRCGNPLQNGTPGAVKHNAHIVKGRAQERKEAGNPEWGMFENMVLELWPSEDAQ